MSWSPHITWFAVALSALGCSSGGASDAGAPAEFVPFASSFQGFHDWSNAPATAPGDASDGLHGVGPLQVYWNESPPHGATSFPVGTIIVKETEQADPTQRTIFAMVKRGGGFNSGGANGWEWFSLQNDPDGGVTPLWGNVVAPAGETYANQVIGDCNGCHALVAGNDYVWDSALQLSNF
jgi:Cytochrome P460